MPKTVGEVRQLAGILSYYRRYIRYFAKIAKPIYDLLTTMGNTGQLPSYASRALLAAEKNYHLHAGKLEFLALKWAITDQFRDYLYYCPKFTVFTDNNPLTYFPTSAKLNATGLRWVNELADFHSDVRYRPGKANADADTLSRMPISFEEYMSGCSEMVSQDVLNTVTSSINESSSTKTAWLSSLTTTPVMLEEELGSVCTISPSDLSAAQQEDTTISRVLHFMQDRRRPTYQEKQQETAVIRQLLHEWNRLFLSEDGILYHKSGLRNQIFLPTKYHKRVYEELHENMGQLEADRVIELARECFYWPFMRARYHSLCHKSMPVFKAAETSSPC